MNQTQQIREAITNLATQRHRDGLPPIVEARIASCVHSLLKEGGDHIRRKRPTIQQSQRQLEAVVKCARSLLDALDRLDAPGRTFLPQLEFATMQVENLEILAKIPTDRDLDAVHIPVAPSPSERLALTCGYVFFVITGDMPTRRVHDGSVYGPFYDFVQQIFRARGVTASPENHVKWAIKAMEK